VFNFVDFVARCGGVDKLHKYIYNVFKVVEKKPPVRGKIPQSTELKPWVRDLDNIIFPKFLLTHDVFGQLIQETITEPPQNIRETIAYELKLDLFEYQKIAVEYAKSQNINYLQLETGMGKTMIAIGLFAALRVPTVVIVQTLGLAEQMEGDFRAAIPDINIVKFDNVKAKRKTMNFTTHDVIIIVNKTLSDKPQDFLAGCGLAIVDEAHTFTSATNIEILWLLQCVPKILALSATPAANQLSAFATRFFGEPVPVSELEGTSITEGCFRVKVRKIEYFGDTTKPWCQTMAGFYEGQEVSSAIKTISSISHDPARNLIIVREIVRLREAGHGVIVFFELKHHLELVRTMLSRLSIDSLELEDAPEVSILQGGAAKSAVTDAKEMGAHIVLTTYGFSRFGISLTQMTALVLASPRRNGSAQIIGRILRKGSDEKIVREIIDFVDMNVSLKTQYTTRKSVYTARNYPIETLKIKYNEVPDDLRFKDIQFEEPIQEPEQTMPDDEYLQFLLNAS